MTVYGFFSASAYKARQHLLGMAAPKYRPNRPAPYVVAVDWRGEVVPVTHINDRPVAQEFAVATIGHRRIDRRLVPFSVMVANLGGSLWRPERFENHVPEDVPDGVLVGKIVTMHNWFANDSFMELCRENGGLVQRARAKIPALLLVSERVGAAASAPADPWADPAFARRKSRRGAP